MTREATERGRRWRRRVWAGGLVAALLGGAAAGGVARADEGESPAALRARVARALEHSNQALAAKFARADRDGDGVLGPDEVPGDAGLFRRLDLDRDGRVTRAEALVHAVDEEVAGAFSKHDQDRSGGLSREELPEEGRFAFPLIDADGDGAVSPDEARTFLHAARLEGLRAAKRAGAAAGRDGAAAGRDGAAGKARAKEAPGATLEQFLREMQRLDRDGDGRIARGEFPGSTTLFGRADRDGDGTLDEAELRVRYRQAERLGRRGEELRALGEKLGVGPEEFAIYGREAKGLFEAGRLEEIEELLDEVELRLERRAARAR